MSSNLFKYYFQTLYIIFHLNECTIIYLTNTLFWDTKLFSLFHHYRQDCKWKVFYLNICAFPLLFLDQGILRTNSKSLDTWMWKRHLDWPLAFINFEWAQTLYMSCSDLSSSSLASFCNSKISQSNVFFQISPKRGLSTILKLTNSCPWT